MIIQCPKCKRKYEVNDTDVPIGGGPVRCPDCSNIFVIYREPLDIELVPIKEEVAIEVAIEEEVAIEPSLEERTITPPIEKVIEEEKERIEVEIETETVPSVSEVKERLRRVVEKRRTGAEVLPESWSEELKKKHERARRLARSLAKDILLYHKEEVERGIKEGNLAAILRNEIKKSWQFFKRQVGEDVLKEKNYFKDALNEILGEGKEIFV
ncbi:zinc-ribbon domain-containing protein [candidate division WOR-3 bacterium]|nr:zinc-ribbon domain-containing protein [candidate division WOR-3 bacterium]